MKASKLAKGARGRKPGVCPVCKKPLTHTVVVQVGRRKEAGGIMDTASKSIAMCDDHAGDLWLDLAQKIEDIRS